MKTSFKFNNNHEKTFCNAISDNPIFNINNIVITPIEYGYHKFQPINKSFLGIKYQTEKDEFVQTGWRFYVEFPDPDELEYFIPLNLDEEDNLTHVDFLKTLGDILYITYNFNTNMWTVETQSFKYNELNDDYKKTVQNLANHLIKKIEEVYGEN